MSQEVASHLTELVKSIEYYMITQMLNTHRVAFSA